MNGYRRVMPVSAMSAVTTSIFTGKYPVRVCLGRQPVIADHPQMIA
jgi:hypothetical protein